MTCAALTVTLDAITSDATPHTARRHPATGVGTGLWAVTWLPARVLTRDQAITAIRIAAFAAGIGEGSLGQLARWAYELDLDAEQAWNLATSAVIAA